VARKVFLDLGCRMGEGFSELAPNFGVDETWEVFAFEVNPDAIAQYDVNIKSGKYDVLNNKNITLINKGVWIEETILPLHREVCSKDYYDKDDEFKEWVDTVNQEFEDGKCLSRHDFDVPDSGGSTLGPLFGYMDRSDAPQRDKLEFHPDTINVECIDFSQWMKNNLSPDDHIVLKMDIEGSEFAVLPKMLQDKTIGWANALIIEWHAWEFKQFEGLRQHLMKEINSIPTIEYSDWK